MQFPEQAEHGPSVAPKRSGIDRRNVAEYDHMLVVDAQLDAGQEPDRVFHATGEWDSVIGDVRRAESLIGMPVREIHERPAAAPVVGPGGVRVVVYDCERGVGGHERGHGTWEQHRAHAQ